METILRRALIEWLASDPLLSTSLNSITEEAPSRTAAPWLGIVASASADWSTKGRRGREIRIAIELNLRGEGDGETAGLTGLVEDRIATLPSALSGCSIINTTFLRARAEQRPQRIRAVLLEYRFRLLET